MASLQRLRMSWEDYLALPERPRAEWVDGEVVVSPPVSPAHGAAVVALGARLRSALPGLQVMTEVGVWLPGNRLRAPDLTVVERWPDGPAVTDVPVLVAEVLSPSTRSEDLLRKSTEYAAAGVRQYWVVDPEARIVDVFANAGGGWEPLVRVDERSRTAEIRVGEHGVVLIDLAELVRD